MLPNVPSISAWSPHLIEERGTGGSRRVAATRPGWAAPVGQAGVDGRHEAVVGNGQPTFSPILLFQLLQIFLFHPLLAAAPLLLLIDHAVLGEEADPRGAHAVTILDKEEI